DAGADDPEVPEPGYRGGAGDRGADPTREGDARSRRARRAARPQRGRARLLRRPRDERQRRESARRRDSARHRPRAGRDRAQQRNHRLDASRKRASAAPGPRQTDPAQARVPPGQAGEGNADRPGTGRAPLLRMGYGMRWASNNSMQLTALRAAADAERYVRSDALTY